MTELYLSSDSTVNSNHPSS